MKYETVCGLEVHTELATKTKIFCGCTTAFGGEVNTHCCPVCTGMPGALPMLNETVLEYALRCGLALHGEIMGLTQFDRKNYFYPDLPKAYQISQLYLPFCRGGYVEITDRIHGGTKRVHIHEIHMEEDAGKLIHRNGRSLINYNRAGVPLLEIVSEPELACGEEAAEYVEKLREILRYIGVSDGKMQEGSLRADVNVSVREQGSKTLGTRTELKNLSSLKAIRAAVDFEAQRQSRRLAAGRKINRETRRWDEAKGVSVPMRTKEDAQDYKYFPEPDIPPVVISDEQIEAVRRALPELPEEKRRRFRAMGLPAGDAALLCSEPAYAALFEETLAFTESPKLTANWLLGEVLMLKKEGAAPPSAKAFAAVINLVKEGRITREAGKQVLRSVCMDGAEPLAYIREHTLETVSDTALLEAVCRRVIADNTKAVREYKKGKEKSFHFLFGQCMRELKGKASPQELKAQLLKLLQ